MCRNYALFLAVLLLGLGGAFFLGMNQTVVETAPPVDITAQPEQVVIPTTLPTNTPEATMNSEFPDVNFNYTEEADADVEYVRAIQQADGTWTFHVTVRHPDTGWEDYADGWDVVLSDGQGVIRPDPSQPFTRVLFHPHENEQPFTRSQSGIVIPEWATIVTVRAHDIVHGFGGREVTVVLTTDEGTDYVVERAE